MTNGEPLRRANGLVKAGPWLIGTHVFRDYPERNTNPAEVKAAILASFTIAFQPENNRW